MLKPNTKEFNLIFTKLSPFDIAFVNYEENAIVIDEAFMGSPALPYIIKHEQQHLKSKGKLDFLMDLKQHPFKVRLEFLKLKPFSIFQFLFPVTCYRLNGKWKFGIVGSRLVILIFIFLFVKVLSVVV